MLGIPMYDCGIGGGSGARGIAGEDCFRRVLLILYPGHFMWPLAVPGLGLRYLVIRFTVMLGQPLRKPFCVAYSNDDIMGLPSDWWEI